MNEITMNSLFSTTEELMKLRVDREKEVENCVNTLLKTNLNIYIYGERGVGKTFLLKAIYNELLKQDRSVFPFFVNIFHLHVHESKIDDSLFYKLIVVEFLAAIWSEIYNRPYSALLNPESFQDSNDRIETIKEKLHYLRKLYSQINSDARRLMYETENNIGVSSIIKGKMGDKFQSEREFSKLLPSEIIDLIEELKSFLNVNEDKRKIIVICDEANLMSKKWQKEIVKRHLDIFTSLNLQFVFVSGYLMKYKEIPECFEYIFKLKGLPSKYTYEFLQKHFPDQNIVVEQKILDYLCNACNGNPRQILQVINSIINLNDKNSSIKISKKDVQHQVFLINQFIASLRK